jgi:hypothetical protein
MKRAPGTHRQGFTLLEMVALTGGLVAVMLLGSTVLIGVMQTDYAATAGHRRLIQRNTLADQFRVDVSEAATAPDRFAVGEKKETAGPTCLILARPDRSEVMYTWGEGELWRWETPPAGKKSALARRPVLVGSDCQGIEFIRGTGEKGGRPLITMRLALGAPNNKQKRSIEVTGVLGGDLR